MMSPDNLTNFGICGHIDKCVYDLPNRRFVDRYKATDLDGNKRTQAKIGCTSLVWSKNQQHLYAGFTDGFIRVLAIVSSDQAN